MRARQEDRERLAWYMDQVKQSRQITYEFCSKHGFPFWVSGANFVLARVGPQAGSLVSRLAATGIHIRDKSADPGCAGCIRVTTGIVEHTRRCLDAMEEML